MTSEFLIKKHQGLNQYKHLNYNLPFFFGPIVKPQNEMVSLKRLPFELVSHLLIS